jgi:peptide/nickel transport system substrate-binding protein
MPPQGWAFEADTFQFTHDVARARALLDEAGYRDPDGDGPRPRFHLSLKTSTQEYSRLQATVIQQDLEAVGIAVDVRSYEFATMYADVLEGAFEMVGMQWVGVSDPDMLRRVFASSQVPPAGFNRGFFRDPRVDRLIDEATVATDMDRRRRLYEDVQRIVAVEAPYISLWYKTNVAVAQRSLTGIRLLPNADFSTLKDVARRPASASVASN